MRLFVEALTQPRGDHAADRMLRVTGGLALAATAATLLVPAVAPLVPFVLFTIWTNGPHSPLLPASHEPVLMLYGRLFPPILIGGLGTAGIVLAEWINYRLYAEAAGWKALVGVRHTTLVERLTQLFARRPFLAIVLAAITPVPYWIARALSVLARYPVAKHLVATAIGRFPRLTFFAALGSGLSIPTRWLVGVTLASVLIGIGLALLPVLRRRLLQARRVPTMSISSKPIIAGALGAFLLAQPQLLDAARVAPYAPDTTTTYDIVLAPAETVSVTIAGQGYPIVFLPGLFGSAFAFRAVTAAMVDAGYQTIVVEPLGVGGSSRPRHADYSLTAQAFRVATVMDSLGLSAAVVVAHSIAGSIAFRLAVARPDLVARLVSIEGGPAESAVTPAFRLAMRFAPLLRALGGPGLIRNQVYHNLKASSGDPSWVTAEIVEGYTADAARDLGATLDAFRGMADAEEPEPLAPRLSAIRCPVILLLGAAEHKGSVNEDEIRSLEHQVPNLTIERIANVGHFVFEEDLAVVSRVVHAAAAAVSPPRSLRAATGS